MKIVTMKRMKLYRCICIGTICVTLLLISILPRLWPVAKTTYYKDDIIELQTRLEKLKTTTRLAYKHQTILVNDSTQKPYHEKNSILGFNKTLTKTYKERTLSTLVSRQSTVNSTSRNTKLTELKDLRYEKFHRLFPLTLFKGSTNKEEQTQRKNNLKALCSTGDYPTSFAQLNKKERAVLISQFLVSEKYKFLYCFVPKVSCTNWRRVLLVLENVTQEYTSDKMLKHPPGLKFLASYSEEEIDYRFKNYYKFVFVRNPMERLLSAFRNRLKEVPDVMVGVGVKIKKKYGNYTPSRDKKVAPGSDVTYEEYVRFLVDQKVTEEMDSHWAPMYILTQPCLVKYDYIGSFDHLYDDAEVVLRTVNAPEQIHFPGRQSYYNPTTYERTIKYYSEVETQYMKQLIEKFYKDFLLFSYPIPNPENLHSRVSTDTLTKGNK